MFVLGVTMGSAVLAQEAVVNFEESWEDRQALGFTTATVGGADDFPHIDGIGNGDPGNWQLEGTNGSSLLGFWGSWLGMSQGYTGPEDTSYASISFVVPETSLSRAVDVQFDVVVVKGYAPILESYVFHGFRDGELVASVQPTFVLQTVNAAEVYVATVNFADIDEIRLNSSAPGGLDNFHFTAAAPIPEPTTTAVAIGALSLLGAWIVRRRRA